LPFFDLLPIPGLRDIVDIGFLTVVAYHLYSWFKGTRTLRVLIGLLALGGIYSVARLWGLSLTTWVFQVLWQVLLILLLILFQSEIRQVFERVSPLKFFRWRRAQPGPELPSTLSRALFELAAQRTGALVVLQRSDGLTEFLHGGQSIMAIPEPNLIKSIFNPGSPAHDGAVLIAEGRLSQMGCILPLSTRADLPEKYGTRHRAAVGITEVADAVCLVVSEERAEVSTVQKGVITVWRDPEAMARVVRQWTGGADPVTRYPSVRALSRSALVDNWKKKLAALALVTGAWVIAASQQDIVATIEAPILHVNTPAGILVAEGSARSVQLTISGSRAGIGGFRAQDIKVLVDLNRLAAGEHMVQLSGRNVDLPLGLKIERVMPQRVRVLLKPQRAKDG
jgi:uncharacterized protein (TIGR00159 family)